MKGTKRLVVTALVCSFLITGCYGSFSAFNKLRAWNQTASDQKWVNEGIFLVLTIIPVYSLAMFGDVIIFNSVEFWTGENPMAKAKFSSNGDKKAVQKFSQDENGKHMQVLYYEKNQLKETVSLNQATETSPLTGHVVSTDGRTQDFTIQSVEEGLQVTRTDSKGRISSQVYSGIALDRIGLRMAEICNTMRLAEATQ
jgi:uncharacterized lipoprotein YehR (DUF1307 family)